MSDFFSAANVSLSIRGTPVIRAVSFDLNPGEIVAVVGPNGAGKTSLLESVVGLRPAKGAILFRGRPLRTLRERADVFAYAADEFVAAPELTVDDTIIHAAKLGRTKKEDLEGLVQSLQISNLRRFRMGTLSRGERKRVALLSALCTSRPIVVLDEPFGVFDPFQLRAIFGVLRERTTQGVSLLASIHQLGDAERIADRFLLLSDGRAVAQGTLHALRTELGVEGAGLETIFLRALGAGDASS